MEIKTHYDAWSEFSELMKNKEVGIETVRSFMQDIESRSSIDLMYCVDFHKLTKSFSKILFQNAHDKDLVYKVLAWAEKEYTVFAEPILWHWKYYSKVKPTKSKKYFVTWRRYTKSGIETKTNEMYYDCEKDAWDFPECNEKIDAQKVFAWAEKYRGYDGD